MFGAIAPFVTRKKGVCMELFNPLVHVRGVHVWGYSSPCYHEEGCMYGAI
jgi:hypothetical protein